MSEVKENLEPKWYVVHTYSGYENKVKTDLEKTVKNRELEDYFFEIVVPMEEQIEIKDGKTKSTIRKVFPGYVLIKMIMTDETWYIVRNTHAVTSFVGSGTKPVPLTDEEMKILNEAKHNQELINIRKQIMLSYSKQKHKHYLDKLKNILGEELYKKVTNQQFRSKQAQIFSQYNDRALKKMELEIAKEKKNSNEY